MAAAYSMDLRTRVLKDSDAGLSSKELAERYHVSRAWVDALKQRRRETGVFAPLKPTKFRGRALAASDLDRLTAFMLAGTTRAFYGAAAFVVLAPFIRTAIWVLAPSVRDHIIGHSFETVADAIAIGCLLAGTRD